MDLNSSLVFAPRGVDYCLTVNYAFIGGIVGRGEGLGIQSSVFSLVCVFVMMDDLDICF